MTQQRKRYMKDLLPDFVITVYEDYDMEFAILKFSDDRTYQGKSYLLGENSLWDVRLTIDDFILSHYFYPITAGAYYELMNTDEENMVSALNRLGVL